MLTAPIVTQRLAQLQQQDRQREAEQFRRGAQRASAHRLVERQVLCRAMRMKHWWSQQRRLASSVAMPAIRVSH